MVLPRKLRATSGEDHLRNLAREQLSFELQNVANSETWRAIGGGREQHCIRFDRSDIEPQISDFESNIVTARGGSSKGTAGLQPSQIHQL